MNLFYLFFLTLLFAQTTPETKIQKKPANKSQNIEWLAAELIRIPNIRNEIKGNPEIIDCPYGNAGRFNGTSDGIFLNQMPLEGLEEFTIEVIFYPESGGNFEQRLLHIGEIRGNRVLFETRSTARGWYFDAYINTVEQNVALIDSTLIHPHDQWYHLAFVVNRGNLSTYVNGSKELENEIKPKPLSGGKTSIGVRQNELSWFRGSVYNIRITPQALQPDQFTTSKTDRSMH